jgi:N-acetyl-anhydromuramyl-L-alanine amidase AmpD
MLASRIEAHEADFNLKKTDAQGDMYDFQIDNTWGFPLAFLTPKSGTTGFFYPEKTLKDMVVLHFTAGHLKGDIATLVEQDSHMSTHFVLGRNGVAYQLFNTNYWSYHLGKGCMGGNTPNSKRSIAIEISNIGPLTEKGTTLHDIYGSPYCELSEQGYYIKLSSPWRGYQYFATFTDSQYSTLKNMLTFLCNKWSIPRTIMQESSRYNLFGDNASTYRGICTHANYRADGKVDIGPAFGWDKII